MAVMQTVSRGEKRGTPRPATQLSEMDASFAGLTVVWRAFDRFPVQVEELPARSFPNPGDADRFRQMVEEDVGADRLGIREHRTASGLGFAFPVVVVSGVPRMHGASADPDLAG